MHEDKNLFMFHIHYKETMVELTETCLNQDVINDKKLIENCPK
jgi:hypothetical protein